MAKRSASSSPVPGSKPASSRSSLSELSELEDIEDIIPPPALRRSKRPKIGHGHAPTPVSDTLVAPNIGETNTPRKVSAQARKDNTSFAPAPLEEKLRKSPTKSKKKIQQTLDEPHRAPKGWQEVYGAIRVMRSKRVAPVDTQGCQMAKNMESDPKNKRLITLVSLILSPRTTDKVCDAAVRKLREALGGSVSLEALLAADKATISSAICKVGMWKGKAGYLQRTARMLRDYFDSDVPKTAEELCTLVGVGEKVAFLCLQAAWDINIGICVDTHVQRITTLLGWHNRAPKTPEETRLNLQSWLPTELWPDINPLLVGFGQTVCTPKKPHCNECTLSVRGLCPSARPDSDFVSKIKTRKVAVKRASRAKVKIAIDMDSVVGVTVPVLA